MKSFTDPYKVDFFDLDVEKYFYKILEIAFSENEIENRINDYENLISKRFEDIENRFSLSPLPYDKFYSDLNIELRGFEFEYLEEILDGDIISNLKDENVYIDFLNDLIQIKILIYVEEHLKNKIYPKPLIQPLQWNGQINTLPTIFFLLQKSKVINGSKEDIKRLLMNNFQINGDSLSPSYLKDIFDENKAKYDKKAVELLKSFLDYLIENIPKQ